MCDARLAKAQHGVQNLVEGGVGDRGRIGLRQARAVREPGHQGRVPARPEPAGGQHLRHQHAGPSRRQDEVRLVLHLEETVEDQGGTRVAVEAEPP